jgi:hypothetical protein
MALLRGGKAGRTHPLPHGLCRMNLTADGLRARGGEHAVEDRLARTLVLNQIHEYGGPLIFRHLSEDAQNAFDAACKKRHRFLFPSRIALKLPTDSDDGPQISDPFPGCLEVYRRISALSTRSTLVTVRRMVFFVSSVYPDSVDFAISFGWKPWKLFCIIGFILVATRTTSTRSSPG